MTIKVFYRDIRERGVWPPDNPISSAEIDVTPDYVLKIFGLPPSCGVLDFRNCCYMMRGEGAFVSDTEFITPAQILKIILVNQ